MPRTLSPVTRNQRPWLSHRRLWIKQQEHRVTAPEEAMPPRNFRIKLQSNNIPVKRLRGLQIIHAQTSFQYRSGSHQKVLSGSVYSLLSIILQYTFDERHS